MQERNLSETSEGFVLVGGRSRRMGRDKALLALGGEPLAHRLALRVRAAAGRATLVGERATYHQLEQLGWRLVEDLFSGTGPLGGIHAALRHTQSQWTLVAACDLPFLTCEFLEFLLYLARDANPQLVVPVSKGYYEPLVAVYRSDCLAEVEAALAAQRYKLSPLFDRLHRREVLPDEWRRFDSEGLLFENVNTPEEFERAQRRAEGKA